MFTAPEFLPAYSGADDPAGRLRHCQYSVLEPPAAAGARAKPKYPCGWVSVGMVIKVILTIPADAAGRLPDGSLATERLFRLHRRG